MRYKVLANYFDGKTTGNADRFPMPRKLAPKKEGDRRGRPRTGRTQFTIRLDPEASATLKDAGKLYRFCELIGLANYQDLDQATAAPAKVIEMLLKQHINDWIRQTLKRLIKGGLPEDVSERLRHEFPSHYPAPDRGTLGDDEHYDR
jgi:hypothetical protein